MKKIKERITDYWTLRAEGFEAQRLRELESAKREIWLREIKKQLPGTKPMRVLDIGTGTGFFACLMASESHQVTGIDLTPYMIEHAKHMASLLKLDVSFYVMDAEAPDFTAESFDVLLTRNLTWTLPDVRKAYCEWFKLLKPGGVMINFDADYYVELGTEQHVKLPQTHAHILLSETMMQENAAITREIGQLQHPRPLWDIQLLMEAGFERVFVDSGVYKRVYAEIDEFYNPAAVFLIAAYK